MLSIARPRLAVTPTTCRASSRTHATAPRASATLSRRDTLLASLALVAAPLPASAAARLPKLDAKRVYGSEEKAEKARAAALTALAPGVTGENAGNLLRMAFDDAGTWDGAKRTGGANGSILLELERPENGGLKYGASILVSGVYCGWGLKNQGETIIVQPPLFSLPHRTLPTPPSKAQNSPKPTSSRWRAPPLSLWRGGRRCRPARPPRRARGRPGGPVARRHAQRC